MFERFGKINEFKKNKFFLRSLIANGDFVMHFTKNK